MASLSEIARKSDEAVRRARAELVRAVRDAATEGLTQVEIAHAIGRSQPEVSRLLRFHGRGPRAEALRRRRREVSDLVAAAGGSDVRVFGSVAIGTDHAGSDVDLVFSMHRPLSLLSLARLERQIGVLLGTSVDLVPESSLRPDLADRVKAEAVAL